MSAALDRDGRAPLRAADWRFLLPHPAGGRFRRLVVLGGPAGLTGRLVESGVAEEVLRELPRDGSVDAVAAFHDAGPSYAAIAAALAPGGALYLEIARGAASRLAATPARVGRDLLRAGLAPTGAYAVGPSLFRPRVYVSLDASGALPWYLRTLFNTWTRSDAVSQAVLRAVVAAGGRRVVPLTPHFAVTAVAGSVLPGAPSVLGLPVLPPGLAGLELHPLLLTSTHHDTLSQRAVILPFTRESEQPLAVVKVSKLPALNETLESEQRTMAELRACLGPALRESIPQPLGLEQVDGLTVATESFCPGEPLQRSSSSWGARLATKLDDLRVAADWLAEFHRETEERRAPWGAAEHTRLLDEPFAAYVSVFGVSEAEAGLFERARRHASTLDGTALPIVLRKPDFFGSNVIRSGDRLAVVDWENPQPGPALCDLLRFVAPWSDAVRHVPLERSIDMFRRITFAPPGADPVADAVRRAIDRYVARLEMDPRLEPLLLVHTWVDRAIHHFEKEVRQGGRPPDPRVGNRHVARVEVLAEHAPRLFDE